MLNDEIVNEFKKYLKRKNLSNNSIIAYLGSVRLFFNMYSEITPENLQQYKSFLISRYRPSTINQRIYAMNHFSRFLTETNEEVYFQIASYHLPSVKVQQKTFMDTIISTEDYELLKNKLKEEKKYFWYFIVRFLAATGARVSELIQIKVEHVNLGYLDLYSKGGKIRRIYFPDSLCTEALDWCNGRDIRSGFLFLNKNGHLITPRGINFQLKHLSRRYGINPDTVYPHSFRHRFAKNFLSRFNDISLLADLMGHDSIETTRIYLTHSSQEQQLLLDEIITW
jgi:site-specific recombinase XerD